MIFEALQPFAISLLLGFGVGIERERKSREGESTMGVRTFTLVALCGTVAGQVGSTALTMGLMIVLAAILTAGYVRSSAQTEVRSTTPTDDARPSEIGLTSEVAAGLVFALGYLARSERLLAGVLGIVLITILYTRRYLHMFSREFLTTSDIAAALTLAVLAFIVMPGLPDRAVDQWGLINPHRFVQIMVLIAGVEFGGYVVERLAGPKIGSLAGGFFGGLASSTAVFLSTAKLSRVDPGKQYSAVGAGLASITATFLLYAAIVATAAPALFVSAGVPVLASAFVAGIGSLIAVRRQPLAVATKMAGMSPLDLKGVFKLTAFVFGMVALSAVVKLHLGPEGVGLVSFITGLFELHATSFAAATLFSAGSLTAHDASRTLLAAALASLVSKLIVCWALGIGRYAMIMTGALLLTAAGGSLVFVALTAMGLAG
jgi:uncharacterized membrane protein (DUF4010 family)